MFLVIMDWSLDRYKIASILLLAYSSRSKKLEKTGTSAAIVITQYFQLFFVKGITNGSTKMKA